MFVIKSVSAWSFPETSARKLGAKKHLGDFSNHCSLCRRLIFVCSGPNCCSLSISRQNEWYLFSCVHCIQECSLHAHPFLMWKGGKIFVFTALFWGKNLQQKSAKRLYLNWCPSTAQNIEMTQGKEFESYLGKTYSLHTIAMNLKLDCQNQDLASLLSASSLS